MTATLTRTAAAEQPSLLGMVANYTRLDLRRALRNPRYLTFTIAFPVVFYLLYTNVIQAAKTADSVDGIPWPAFFMVSMATFGAIGAALAGSRIIATERAAGWTLQLRVMPMRSSAYLVTKLVVSLLTTLPTVLLVMAVAFLVNGVSLPGSSWVELPLFLAIGSLPFAGLGLLIGYLFDADSVQGAFMVTYFGSVILGGLFAPVASFPDTLVTIAHLLPSFHLANLGWNLLSGTGVDLSDVVILAAWTIGVGALVAWRYRSEEQRARG